MKSAIPIPLDAETLHLEEPTFVFLNTVDLHCELRSILDVMPSQSAPSVHGYDRDAWFDLSFRVQAALPVQPPADAEMPACIRSRLEPLPEWQNGVLHNRLAKIVAIVHGLRVPESRFRLGPPPTLAVAPLWNRRIAMLLAGKIHPAWIAGMYV